MSDTPGRFHARPTTAAGNNRAVGHGASKPPRVTPVRFGLSDRERLQNQAIANQVAQSTRWLLLS